MRKIIVAAAAALGVTLATTAAASATTNVTIAEHGGILVGGLRILSYPGHGTLTGAVAGASVGTKVTLQQLTFPFHGSYRALATTTTRSSGAYSFTVRPSVATRYRAVSRTSTSKIVVYYVSASFRTVSWPNCAGQSTCHATAVTDELLPAGVAATEARKHLYFYDGIHAGSVPPTRLYLNKQVTTSVIKITTSRYRDTFTWTMHFPTISTWRAEWCFRDTYLKDGFGLPGAHGCGAASILTSSKYLG